MGRFVSGAGRSQTTLFPECVDDWVDEDNPVRVVDAFVEALDLRELGFEGVVPEATGRPSYHPAVLLKLSEPERPAHPPRDGRAPLRHDQGPHGRDTLPDEEAAARLGRAGAARPRL